MANHSIQHSAETGNFNVVGKDGNILHSFPSEGEALLQVKYLDEQEKNQAKEAKAEKAESKHEDEAPKHSARHR